MNSQRKICDLYSGTCNVGWNYYSCISMGIISRLGPSFNTPRGVRLATVKRSRCPLCWASHINIHFKINSRNKFS